MKRQPEDRDKPRWAGLLAGGHLVHWVRADTSSEAMDALVEIVRRSYEDVRKDAELTVFRPDRPNAMEGLTIRYGDRMRDWDAIHQGLPTLHDDLGAVKRRLAALVPGVCRDDGPCDHTAVEVGRAMLYLEKAMRSLAEAARANRSYSPWFSDLAMRPTRVPEDQECG